MPYTYENAESLEKLPTVGSKQYVALIKEYPKSPAALLWKREKAAKGNTLLKKGTAIATIHQWRLPEPRQRQSCGFYITQDARGITVVDQWSTSGTIRKRHLPFIGKDKAGKPLTPSNNCDAFSVVE